MSVTTGSTVKGTVPGLRKHLGGGAAMMYVAGNPDGVVSPAGVGTAADSGISGNTLAYDNENDTYYENITGSTWQKLGSVS